MPKKSSPTEKRVYTLCTSQGENQHMVMTEISSIKRHTNDQIKILFRSFSRHVQLFSASILVTYNSIMPVACGVFIKIGYSTSP